MAAALEENFKPPQEGNFDPDAFKRGVEVITSMLKPEAVKEFQEMMNPFGDIGETGEPQDLKNVLEQPNKYKWRDNTPNFSKDEMREAFACSKKAHEMKCDCWNTHCVIFGDCRKCLVYEMCLKQLPTCQRDLLEELQQHYNAHSGDK